MAEFAGGQPVLRAMLELDIGNAKKSVEEVAKYAEQTLANPGGGGSEAARQRDLRAKESSLDREISRYAIGGASGSEQAPGRQAARTPAPGTSDASEILQRWLSGHVPYSEAFSREVSERGMSFAPGYGSNAASYANEARRRADDRRDAQRIDEREQRVEDRNETRYSRSQDAAEFSSFKRRERDFARDTKGSTYSGGANAFFDHPALDDYDDRDDGDRRGSSFPRRRGHADRIRRNRELSESRAADREFEEGAPFEDPMDPDAGIGIAKGGKPRLLNRPEDAKGKGTGGGGLSVFYKRFLLLEAVRSVSSAVADVANEPTGMAAVGGNPISRARFTYENLKQTVSDSIPFGVGSAGFAIGDAITGNGRKIAAAERMAEEAVSTHDRRTTLKLSARKAERGASVAETPPGYEREIAGVEAERQNSQDELGREYSANALAERQAHEERIANIKATKGPHIAAVNQENREYRAYKAQRDAEFTQRKEASNRAAAAKSADLARDRAAEMRGYSAGEQLSGAQAGNLLRPSGSDYYDPMFRADQQMQAIDFAEQRKRKEEDSEYDKMSQRDKGQADARRKEQMTDRKLREAQSEVEKREIAVEAGRTRAQQKTALTEDYGVTTSALARDPYGGIQAHYAAEVSNIQFMDPALRGQAQKNAEAHRQLSQQELEDRQHALGGNLGLQLAVSGMRAQAFGPGADAKRRAADVTEIAGSAELGAQGILRSNIGTQSERLQFADAQRQIGVNNLNTYANNYMQGMHFTERSRFDVAGGDKSATNPAVVLRSIDDGIKGLKANVGNGDITGAKGSLGNDSVPNLLSRIVQLMENGVAFGATN